MTGNGSRSDVVPVGVVGSELLTSSGLDDVNPDRYVELTCEDASGTESVFKFCYVQGSLLVSGNAVRDEGSNFRGRKRKQESEMVKRGVKMG